MRMQHDVHINSCTSELRATACVLLAQDKEAVLADVRSIISEQLGKDLDEVKPAVLLMRLLRCRHCTITVSVKCSHRNHWLTGCCVTAAGQVYIQVRRFGR